MFETIAGLMKEKKKNWGTEKENDRWVEIRNETWIMLPLGIN